MKYLDAWTETAARGIARRSSRRGWLKGLAAALASASAMPLLPVARAASTPDAGAAGIPESGDPESCDYWRYCAIDGFLCGCCGGSPASCPAGTEMSPITWIGTCHNPADGRNYVISYNDCCGRTPCGQCLCTRNEGDRPMYRPDKNNDLNWCLGTQSAVYHCSTAIVIGLGLE
ncbi:MAG: methylamine dehydrogenase (amicyanin) light chain [Gammaproteobacteria bacterium]|nr:methylamine dehydrogenase (amicyanin) light chain [Gammaproteobacteria bacterium]